MLTAQYNKRHGKSPIKRWLAACAGLIMVGWMLVYWNPEAWWKEVILVSTLFLSLAVMVLEVFKNKWGIITLLLIFSLLILRRWGALDLLTVSLLIIVLGLISLIN